MRLLLCNYKIFLLRFLCCRYYVNTDSTIQNAHIFFFFKVFRQRYKTFFNGALDIFLLIIFFIVRYFFVFLFKKCVNSCNERCKTSLGISCRSYSAIIVGFRLRLIAYFTTLRSASWQSKMPNTGIFITAAYITV